MLQYLNVLNLAKKVMDSLKSDKTQADLDAIFAIEAEAETAIGNMFSLGKNTAANLCQIFTLAVAAVDRMKDTLFAERAMTKPNDMVETFDDIVENVVAQAKKDSPRAPVVPQVTSSLEPDHPYPNE